MHTEQGYASESVTDHIFSRELHYITETVRDAVRTRVNDTCNTTVLCLRRNGGASRDVRRHICTMVRDALVHDLRRAIERLCGSTGFIVVNSPGGRACWRAVLKGLPRV